MRPPKPIVAVLASPSTMLRKDYGRETQ
jgi:hypothetical protein